MTPARARSLLTDLGLSGYEAAAYLTLLRREVFSAAELSRTSEIPRQRIHDVIASLEEKGLCQVVTDRPHTVAAIEPELAVAALVARRERSLAQEETRLTETAGVLHNELRQLYKKGGAPDGPLRYLQTYKSPVQMAAMAGKLAASARSEMKVFLSGPPAFSREESTRVFAEPLRREVKVRVLSDHSAPPTPELGRLMKDFFLKGLEVRLLEGEPVPLRAQIAEDAVLIYLKEPLAGPPAYSATLARHPAMATAMTLLFETLWDRRRARTLGPDGHPI